MTITKVTISLIYTHIIPLGSKPSGESALALCRCRHFYSPLYIPLTRLDSLRHTPLSQQFWRLLNRERWLQKLYILKSMRRERGKHCYTPMTRVFMPLSRRVNGGATTGSVRKCANSQAVIRT
ncbi:hypothetical protein E2C01_013238 [Portunus trituberculatus]|uniref:Uncharacterized protein n=1 Tax=Portunus trituberculatus TaxID=210409 RepID=A0A5B7DFR0_PORTR|nr:hypothetical protein [Portunus trituberculatus]